MECKRRDLRFRTRLALPGTRSTRSSTQLSNNRKVVRGPRQRSPLYAAAVVSIRVRPSIPLHPAVISAFDCGLLMKLSLDISTDQPL
nr:hypothetical protein HmN_000924200 [Hymenolepis microstoma]